MNNKLFKNTFIISLGNLIPRILALVTLPLITTYISIEVYGQFDIIVTSGSFIIPVVSLLIDQAVFRFLLDEKEENKKITISTAFVFIFILSVVTIFMFFILFDKYDIFFRLLVILYYLALLYNTFFIQTLRGLRKLKVYAISSVLNSAFNILLLYFMIISDMDDFYTLMISIISGISIANLVMFLSSGMYRYISLKLYNYHHFKKMIKYSIPIIPNSISWWILNLSDRFIIRIFLGLQYNAIYAIANKIPILLNVAYSNFNLAWQESAVDLRDEQTQYKSMFTNIFVFLSTSLIVLLAMSTYIFDLLIDSSYDESYKYIQILMLGVYFNCLASFIGGIFLAYKDTKIIGTSSIMSALINISINIILIKHLGLYAAAISTLIAFMVLFVIRFLSIKKYVALSVLSKRNIFIFLMVLLFSFLSFYNNEMLNIIAFVFSGLLFLVLNKKLIINFVMSLVKRRDL